MRAAMRLLNRILALSLAEKEEVSRALSKTDVQKVICVLRRITGRASKGPGREKSVGALKLARRTDGHIKKTLTFPSAPLATSGRENVLASKGILGAGKGALSGAIAATITDAALL